ncbi:hypothetical protein [Shewanella algidipiscicola]|uniref:Antitermination protein NusG n=1 Tax=Shewanella algidipiscicola TaxID=614070 RepID=A0ABQ4NSX1_9GAMM|nr:hypothetical protein [Shewanella algidipiscicola]GIU02433.1 hypothetical protein TUM4630_34060 [Shewanella algidipiscicola]
MLTKILVTLLIIAGALFYVRKPARSDQTETATQFGQRLLFRYVAMGFVVLALFGSAVYWYWTWQDGEQIVSVSIVSPLDNKVNIYQVHKRDISENEFTTVEGIKIRLSTQERIIIAPTDAK